MTPATSPPAERKAPVESRTAAELRSAKMLLHAHPPRKPTWLGRVIRWVILLAVVGAAWKYYPVWWPWLEARLVQRGAAQAKQPPRPIPVVTAPVKQRDLDLYLNGLGTVTALETVTVRSRVEGEILEISFREGEIVEEGALLALIDPRPFERQLAQAKGAVERDRATLNLANLNLKRQEELLRNNATTQALYDQQVATVAQAQAVLDTNQAILENAELQLSYCRITAPISGRVGLRLVDKGNMVRANDPNGIVVITKLDPIGVVFTIPQDEIPRVQKRFQEHGELLVDAFDRNFRNKLASGKLLATDNQVDAMTGTLRLKAMFENKAGVLFPNQFVNARLTVETLKNAYVVPSAAVQRGPEGPFVYVATSDNGVDLRMVATGPTQGTDTAILTGLSLGEFVVTDGLDKLTRDSKISHRNGQPSGKEGAAPAETREQGRPIAGTEKGKA